MRGPVELANCNNVEIEDADQYESRAISRLRDKGLRITKSRQRIIHLLARTRRPLGAYQIRDLVSEKGSPIDVVSVYRTLTALEEAGVMHKISALGGYVACTASRSGPHSTEHLVCHECGCVEEVPIPQQALAEISITGTRHGFDARHLSIEVTGICSHCR